MAYANQNPSGLQIVTGRITSAQILNWFNVPVTLVAAPAANKVIIPTLITWRFKFVSAQYANGAGGAPATRLAYGGVASSILAGGTIPTSTLYIAVGADRLIYSYPTASAVIAPSLATGLALTLQETAANKVPTTGDGYIDFTVQYVITDLS